MFTLVFAFLYDARWKCLWPSLLAIFPSNPDVLFSSSCVKAKKLRFFSFLNQQQQIIFCHNAANLGEGSVLRILRSDPNAFCSKRQVQRNWAHWTFNKEGCFIFTSFTFRLLLHSLLLPRHTSWLRSSFSLTFKGQHPPISSSNQTSLRCTPSLLPTWELITNHGALY